MINIRDLNDKEKMALVCMYFSRMPKENSEYKKRTEFFKTLEGRYGRSAATLKYDKDAFDPYFSTNNREGWKDRPLESRGSCFPVVLEKYGKEDEAVLKEAVEKIIEECSITESNYIAFRAQQPEDVHTIKNGNGTELELQGIYTLIESMTIGRVVFIAFGGDKGKTEVDWDLGFAAIGHITKEPYDVGYQKTTRRQDYYKTRLTVDCVLPQPISKQELIEYPNTFDAPFIGIEIHRSPTQAICQLPDDKAVSIIRATIDKYPNLLEKISQCFSEEFMDRVKGSVPKSISVSMNYGDSVKDAVQDEIREDTDLQQDDNSQAPSISFDSSFSSDEPRNLIVFGAPGTGKSYYLNNRLFKLIGDEGEYERVTFHPEYTYSSFVGTYKPVPAKDTEKNETITYKYVPGPFMRTLVKALRSIKENKTKPFVLLIEEINRSNVASVFGDVFQLLDRNVDYQSEYPIQASEDIKQYLSEELEVDKNSISQIKIPSNMFIWATMNSADQGVFYMDTAFKRRWEFKYLGIDNEESVIAGKYVSLADKRVEWNKLRKAINEFLAGQNINEDKQLGPFFISKQIVVPDNENINKEKFIEAFKNKVIMYLFEDAAKQRRATLFSGCSGNKNRYSEICNEFDKKGTEIFCEQIRNFIS